MNELQVHAISKINFTNIIWSKRSQNQKNICCVISFIQTTF